MNDFLAVLGALATSVSLYALITGTGTRRLAWLTLATANLILLVGTDGSTTAHVLQGLTALIGAAGFIREARKQVAA